MSIQTLQDTGSSYTITSSMDGAVYRLMGGDCVCEGIGDEFDLNYTASSLIVSFDTGSEACICGNLFKVTSSTSLTLTANTDNYVCARIDKTQPNGSRGMFVATTQAGMYNGNINGSDNIRDMLIYIVTTNATGVTGVVDKRVIRGEGTTTGGLSFWCGTQAEYNALAQKYNNTIYFINESA